LKPSSHDTSNNAPIAAEDDPKERILKQHTNILIEQNLCGLRRRSERADIETSFAAYRYLVRLLPQKTIRKSGY